MSETMKAVRVHKFGGPEVLQVDEVPRPVPQTDELLVRVLAAGVLPIESSVRAGKFAAYNPGNFPYIPGTAFAGVVEQVGPGATDFVIGDAICGRSANGTYAEYTTVSTNVVPPEPKSGAGRKLSARIIPLALKPATLSFDQAATLSGGATTAWTSLFLDGDVQAGQRVLIHGGAGGVGLFAVQFAKWKGAYVIATASSENLDFVRSLGADEVIDYRATPFESVTQDLDFVLDTIGGDTLLRSMRLVKRGGTLISVVEPPPAELADELEIRALNNAAFPNSEILRTIVRLIDEGCARPAIRQMFSLEQAPQAHVLNETGHGRGRIVLHIADE